MGLAERVWFGVVLNDEAKLENRFRTPPVPPVPPRPKGPLPGTLDRRLYPCIVNSEMWIPNGLSRSTGFQAENPLWYGPKVT
jgi:hypothetical protein